MPATLISPEPNPLPTMIGKNLAPKRQLDELISQGKTTSPSSFCDSIRTIYEEKHIADETAWREMQDIGKMVANLVEGKLLLMRHAIDNRYLFVKRDSRYADNKTVGGLFQFYWTKLMAEWLSSRPEIDPICPSDDDQVEEFIASVKIVQDFYNTRFFTNRYEQEEFSSAAAFGTWITRYRYDPHIKDVICELLDFPACRWDIRFRAEESPYFIYQSKCATSILRNQFDADISEDGTDLNIYGLQVIEQIAKQGGNVRGKGQERPNGTYNNTKGETIVTEMWLQPEMYCDIDLNEDESTVEGPKLKKGSTLLEMFPDGMCVVGINGMQTIIGVYAENHKDHIVSGIYHLQSFSGVGKGVSDAVDVKKEMDDLHSQTMAYIKAHGTPSYGYNKDIVSEEQARNIGKPRKMIPFDFTNAPDGVNSINQAVQAILPSNPAAAVFQYGQQLENFLQMSFQVTAFSDGLPGVDNKTATGAQIGNANAQTLLVPQHLNKAEHRMRSAKVIYNLFRKYCNIPKFFATKDLNGITKGKYLSGNNFDDVDIDFEIVSNSEVPRTPYAMQQALTQLMQYTGGIGGLIQASQMNPEMTSSIATTFGAKLPIPKQTDIARVCRKRIEQAKKLLEMELQMQQVMQMVTGQPVDNADLSSAIVSKVQPPISPFEPFFQQKVSWLAALLDDDEMQYAPPELRHIIEEMIGRHLQAATLGQAEVAMDQNMATVMGNLPELLGTQIMTKQNQQLQQTFQQQQVAQAQQDAMQNQQMQIQQNAQQGQQALVQSHAEHQMALAENDQQHTQNLALEAARQKGQMAIAKARPQPQRGKK